MTLLRRLLLIGLVTLTPVGAHDIITTKLTFTRDISRVFIRRCQSCHSASASIPLTTYEQARPWAVSIKEQVLSRQMPPWGAVKGYGHLNPDNALTQEEILVIAAWVIGGAPKGDPALLPATVMKPDVPAASLDDALLVHTSVKLHEPLVVGGIRPLGDSVVDSARIKVSFPDGHIEPLLWLSHYNPEWKRTFTFRHFISLPAGCVVASEKPLQFSLMSKSLSH